MKILSKKTPTGPKRLVVDRDFAGRQIIGSRDEQQDSYAFSIVAGDENGADKILVIVADGMGGYIGGREASLTAVSAFVDAFYDALDAPVETPETNVGNKTAEPLPVPVPCPPVTPSDAMSSDSVPEAGSRCPAGATSPLKTALMAANLAVDRMIATDPDKFAEAGTTLVAALIERETIRWISVGDSPLLLWRNGKLSRLNADHSMRSVFAEKVAAGQMRASDVSTHPERNALLSAVNGLDILQIDDPAGPVSLMQGDMVIVASDGLITLSAPEISKELKKLNKAPVLEIVRSLLKKVEKKANPKQDNTTIAIVRV